MRGNARKEIRIGERALSKPRPESGPKHRSSAVPSRAFGAAPLVRWTSSCSSVAFSQNVRRRDSAHDKRAVGAHIGQGLGDVRRDARLSRRLGIGARTEFDRHDWADVVAARGHRRIQLCLENSRKQERLLEDVTCRQSLEPLRRPRIVESN